ncbi:hypothetical protein K491DRAFT_174286 [Lophiostoma macrostomum CBS 122681]|uniref:Zn(2)-C6 fungal-type domain-containing protein n=1 Tax=Lophiostoma macrostomum CBS 122681 TaxID=1314788 RepID=A0A6A6SNZ6_9PLEO|nr:hypothetical protein K491DRAFT_174286 [Lophiostoma macrostomum CBS 122681]
MDPRPARVLPSLSLRTTQRAPRSCLSCASRKVRCDKSVPCSQCIRRGEAASCVRETVIVRGQITTRVDEPGVLTYEELARETARLRAALQANAPRRPREPPSAPAHAAEACAPDHDEAALFQADRMLEKKPIISFNEKEILLPSPQCSTALIAHDEASNSWVHYALEYPGFAHQHSAFLSRLEHEASLEAFDSSWLAVYFAVISAALLTMNDEGSACLDLPIPDVQLLRRNWYDASLYFLHKADFLRRPRIETVQAVAIQGMLYVNFGDSTLYRTMWACAIRVSHIIGLSKCHSGIVGLSQQAQHRLWWTLVICAWMGGAPTSNIHEDDFTVPLPQVTEEGSVSTGDGSRIHPVQYHIFMSRAARAYHHFQLVLRTGQKPKMEVVRAADERLAELIDGLPHHLQPGRDEDQDMELQRRFPWIKWQSVEFTLSLLYHRLCLYRVLQDEWMQEPEQYASARAVCLITARDIIWVSQHWELPHSERRQWPFALHLFCAGSFLIREGRRTAADAEADWIVEVEKCISYLDQVSSWNALAAQASNMLQQRLDSAISAATKPTG